MSLGSVRLVSMGPRVGWATLALVLEIALPALIITLATHPTTLALVGQGAGRVRSEGEALRRRHAERLSREAATASLIDREEGDCASGADEAWAEASAPAATGDATAGAEAGAEPEEQGAEPAQEGADEGADEGAGVVAEEGEEPVSGRDQGGA